MSIERIIFSLLSLFLFGCEGADNELKDNFNKLQTVEYVDIDRFMGDWYVIANIPTFIEKRATNAIESYKLDSDGNINTEFTFYQDSPNGKLKRYNPKGFIFNKETNAEWRMQFIWPIKMPFLIIDLSDDYRYTVIGEPNRKYLWIMARNHKISDFDFDQITGNLHNVGYDTSLIRKVIQDW